MCVFFDLSPAVCSLFLLYVAQFDPLTSLSPLPQSRYTFLLKGHEDLRQDERVMQVFGLVNTLLTTDDATSKAHLAIQRYSVIPLSPNSGLIGCEQ